MINDKTMLLLDVFPSPTRGVILDLPATCKRTQLPFEATREGHQEAPTSSRVMSFLYKGRDRKSGESQGPPEPAKAIFGNWPDCNICFALTCQVF